MSDMPHPPEVNTSDLLLRLARQVTARHHLDDVLAEVFRCLRPIVGFGGGSIQLLDDDGWIRMAACDPAAPEHVMAQRVPLGSSVAGRVILTEQAVYLPDIEVTVPDNGNRVTTGVRSYLGVPLVADGRAIGLLQVDSAEPDAWSAADRSLVLGAAPIVAAAIQNARAHARATESRVRAEMLESRLRQARQLTAAMRTAMRNGDRLDLERRLHRLESLLDTLPLTGEGSNVVRLPVQQAHVPHEAVRR
jgi:GAF domain-containing protein